MQQELSQHLLNTLPIDAIGTFTFPQRCSQEQRDTAWNEYVDKLEATAKHSIGWIRADETDAEGNRHIHAAFASFQPLSKHQLMDCWAATLDSTRSDLADCSSYDSSSFGTAGLQYIVKDDDLTLSSALHLYSTLTDPSTLPAYERRQFTRVRK